ncbi:MAG TPA: hypothetical protein PK610_02205, partial [Flavobacteriales bacterium]|nr:hypothetical protein [Flavobacteriales bacterium]
LRDVESLLVQHGEWIGRTRSTAPSIEEITDEYGLFNSGWEIDLVCTKPGCRKKLQPSDLDLNYEKWDAAIKSAFDYFEKVDQPLLKYMEPEIKDKLNRFLKEGRDYISVLELKIK